MEVTVLKRKKTTISKGKIKKTIKNVICRPDPIYWPIISDEEKGELLLILNKYRVDIPEFKKPHWKDLKSIPKSERPRKPLAEKVEGLVFGLSQCHYLIESNQLAGLILENDINPKSIAQPMLELSNNNQVPALCFTGLREISAVNFGIKTSCLGVKKEFLTDLANKILQVSKYHQHQNFNGVSIQNHNHIKKINHNVCDIITNEETSNISSCVPYLYRTDKKRVFVPIKIEKPVTTTSEQFNGQDFIEFCGNKNKENDKVSKAYKKMVVKRISNNPNRAKIK